MKCYTCGYANNIQEFGTLEAKSGSEWACIVGSIQNKHVGSVDIYVCPHCGALHTTMKGLIGAEDRKV
jgi:hypothetical protein